MRPNTGFYAREINDLIQNTEQMGDKLHPSYEKIRNAIDHDQTADLDDKTLAEIHELFEKGTAVYRQLGKQIGLLKPPAKVIGNHKRLEKAYLQYVAGCQEMTDSLQPSLDQKAFDLAEQKQDEATDTIYKTIQKITNLLLQ